MPIDIVVTAARAAQARGYQALLEDRERRGELPHGGRWHVVTDPHGRRAGSGTATALAIDAVLGSRRSTSPSSFQGRRILIIHSGGDSRRLPAFAALGKAFAPLPRPRADGSPATIFDLVLADLLALDAGAEGGVLVASGDAVVGAGAESIDLSGEGVVGIAQEGSIERGSRHGVYVAGPRDTVRDFLQKPSPARAKAAGAVGPRGTLLIDTGIVRFAPRAAASLMQAFGAGRRGGLLDRAKRGVLRPLDLYEHVMTALVPGLSTAGYLRRLGLDADDRDRAPLDELRITLGRVGFSLRRSSTEGFLHLGTTRECLDLLLRDRATCRRYGLEPPEGRVRRLGEFGSTVSVAARARGAVVSGSLRAHLDLGGDNLVHGLPPRTRLALRRGFGCVALPVGRREWATILFHVDDDAKSRLVDSPRFAGTRFDRLLERARLPVSTVGGRETATLWEARLWRVTRRPEVERWMMDLEAPTAAERSAKRYAIAELLERVDHRRVVALEREIAVERIRADPAGALRSHDRLGAELIAALADRAPARRAISRGLLSAANGAVAGDPLAAARLFATAGRLSSGASRLALRAKALAAVGDAVAEEVAGAREASSSVRAAIRPDETVWASAPARIDLAGGWSDTPPICHERGGAVVNLAIDLDSRPPVNAIAKLAERPWITIHSVDLGESRTIRTSAELFDHRDPRDWTALAKAALRLSGIAPPSPTTRLDRWMDRFGGGLSLSMLAAVPKGSGLGTSSILGATVLACLDRVVGRRATSAELVSRTSLLEQMIATRGGWQDQIGGIEAGLKIARSEPGTTQRPRVEAIALTPSFARELRERSVLCYTGRRRMARDILERVVERYLARDRGVVELVDRLKAGAERLAIAAEASDVLGFAREVGRYWAMKTELDPLSITPEILAMARAFDREALTWTLPGAGGGGFLLFIAKDRRAAARIERAFRERPMHPLARVVEWSIAEHGLRLGSV